MASKLHERIFVENCLSHLGPDYVIAEERKSPDLIISKGDERFGIEVAQVFRDQSPHGSPTKARESRRVQYLNRLASKYYSCDGLPLLVKANISGPPERDIGAVVDRLKVERLPSTSGKSRFEMGCSTFHLMALPAEAGPYQRWICINNSVGWRGAMASKDIQPRIDEKASKLSSYRKAIARVELLLVVDTSRTSGMVRRQKSAQFPAKQGFDAIHLYFYQGGSMIAKEQTFTF